MIIRGVDWGEAPELVQRPPLTMLVSYGTIGEVRAMVVLTRNPDGDILLHIAVGVPPEPGAEPKTAYEDTAKLDDDASVEAISFATTRAQFYASWLAAKAHCGQSITGKQKPPQELLDEADQAFLDNVEALREAVEAAEQQRKAAGKKQAKQGETIH